MGGVIKLHRLQYGDKHVFSSISRSNLDDISGLSNVNEKIKENLSYVYLHCNNINSLTCFEDYSGIEDLEINCNSNLSSLNGLQNNKKLTYLAVHDCNLNSLLELAELQNLQILTIQNNVNLQSLNGLENDTKLIRLLADHCNLQDITALARHTTNLINVNLEYNTNLEHILTLQSCVKIVKLYLAGNENMIGTDVRDALAITGIILNCGNNYSLPSKYNLYFADASSLMDYSFSSYNKYLTDSSDEINALKGKSNIEILKLNGQNQLSNEKLQEILGSLKGLKCVALEGCSNLASLDFLNTSKCNVYEIDLRGTSNSLVDISLLGTYNKNLRTIFVDNPNLDLSNIADICNSFPQSEGYKPYYLYTASRQSSGGLLFFSKDGNDVTFQFPENQDIMQFVGGASGFVDEHVTLDFSKCKNLTWLYSGSSKRKYILPASLINLYCGGFETMDLSGCTSLTLISTDWFCEQLSASFATIPQVNSIKVIYLWICNDNGKALDFFKNEDGSTSKFSGLESLYIANNKTTVYNLDFIKQLKGLTHLQIRLPRQDSIDFSGLDKLISLKCSPIDRNDAILKNINVTGCTNLQSIVIYNMPVNDIIGISDLINLKDLQLTYTKFSNLPNMSKLKNLGNGTYLDYSKNEISSVIDFSNNSIVNLLPLLGTIGEDGKIKYKSINLSNNSLEGFVSMDNSNIETLKKLHDAGLEKVIITGNSFNESDLSKLREVFGASNVIF